jgi:hypothetical protein
MGYEKAARGKLIQNSLLGGGIGMVVGYLFSQISLYSK